VVAVKIIAGLNKISAKHGSTFMITKDELNVRYLVSAEVLSSAYLKKLLQDNKTQFKNGEVDVY